jgi:hypothetical protein
MSQVALPSSPSSPSTSSAYFAVVSSFPSTITPTPPLLCSGTSSVHDHTRSGCTYCVWVTGQPAHPTSSHPTSPHPTSFHLTNSHLTNSHPTNSHLLPSYHPPACGLERLLIVGYCHRASHLPPLFHCYATPSRLSSSAQSSHISYCLYYVWLLIVTSCILGAQQVIGEDPHGSSPISLVVLGMLVIHGSSPISLVVLGPIEISLHRSNGDQPYLLSSSRIKKLNTDCHLGSGASHSNFWPLGITNTK